MDYIQLAKTTDFAEVNVRSYSLMGKRVAVVKRDDNTFFAIEANCKHQGADLTTGSFTGLVVTCPRHQWRYDLETGECLNHESLPLRRYDLYLEGEKIMVSLTPFEA